MSRTATTTSEIHDNTRLPEDAAGTPAQRIDARIAQLVDWRGAMLARVRGIIRQADPEIVEEWKWRGVPVWSRAGILCTGETYKAVVKLTFARGAALDDPAGLFNASLEGGTRRAIDIRQGEDVDEGALSALIRAAAALNLAASRLPRGGKSTSTQAGSRRNGQQKGNRKTG
jgi:hypothetical protein